MKNYHGKTCCVLINSNTLNKAFFFWLDGTPLTICRCYCNFKILTLNWWWDGGFLFQVKKIFNLRRKQLIAMEMYIYVK